MAAGVRCYAAGFGRCFWLGCSLDSKGRGGRYKHSKRNSEKICSFDKGDEQLVRAGEHFMQNAESGQNDKRNL